MVWYQQDVFECIIFWKYGENTLIAYNFYPLKTTILHSQ